MNAREMLDDKQLKSKIESIMENALREAIYESDLEVSGRLDVRGAITIYLLSKDGPSMVDYHFHT